MVQKVKFKALTYQGKVIHFTKEFECPDFEIVEPYIFNGVEIPGVSIESQVISWLDEQDKSGLMYEMDLSVIIDYFIPKKKQKQPSVLDYIKTMNFSNETLLDIIAIYKEIKPALKGKSPEKQVEILFSHLNIAYQSATVAYKNISAMLNGETESNQKLLNN